MWLLNCVVHFFIKPVRVIGENIKMFPKFGIVLSFLFHFSILFMRVHGNTDACPEMTQFLGSITSHGNGMTCSPDGIECSSFTCSFDKDISHKVTFKGSWLCDSNQRSFDFQVLTDGGVLHSSVILNDVNKTKNFGLAKYKLNINITISFEGAFEDTFIMDLGIKGKLMGNDVNIPIKAKRDKFPMNCKCKNVKDFQKDVLSKFKGTSLSCWGLNSSCLSYLCHGRIKKPELIHFSFTGTAKCDNLSPKYKVELLVHHDKVIYSEKQSIIITSSKDEINVTMDGQYELKLSLNGTFHGKKITTSIEAALLNSSVPISNLKYDMTMGFSNLTCSTAPSTKTASTTSLIMPSTITFAKKSATNASLSPTKAATLLLSPTTTTTVLPPTSSSSIAPKPSRATSVLPTSTKIATLSPSPNPDGTSKNSNTSASHPAKVVLIVLAVLIIVSTLLVFVYLKRRRRLSNQPAYYNDIALNDPLRYELDNDEQEDDDELPLFT